MGTFARTIVNLTFCFSLAAVFIKVSLRPLAGLVGGPGWRDNTMGAHQRLRLECTTTQLGRGDVWRLHVPSRKFSKQQRKTKGQLQNGSQSHLHLERRGADLEGVLLPSGIWHHPCHWSPALGSSSIQGTDS